jgi:hypothetical protein
MLAGINLLMAQQQDNSPYSRFGIGDIFEQGSGINSSMGGISYGYADAFHININNPASYISIDTTTFVVNGGIGSEFKTLKSNGISEKSSTINMTYLFFGFPVAKWCKFSFGLLPYSKLNYNISDPGSQENTGSYEHLYQGSGGLNRFYAGTSVNLFKGFSLGMNASYFFGPLDNEEIVNFPDSIYIQSLRVKNSIYVEDFHFSFGAQYSSMLSQSLKLTLGASLTPSIILSAEREYLVQNFFPGNNGIEYPRDTISYLPSEDGDIKLPLDMGFGFTLKKGERWMLGMDFQQQNWEDFSSYGVKDSLSNSQRISIGGMYKPESTTVSKYWKRLTYRFGLKYKKTFLNLNNTQLNEYGISFGVDLPLMKSKSALNLGFEIGQRGTTDEGLIKETYGKISVGLSIRERWFILRKYD